MGRKQARSAQLTNPIEQLRAVPIGDYGFLSDGEVSALVAPAGAVEWMCVPRFDAGSVFGAILGQRAGSFRVAPLDARVPAARRYLPGTMVLETSWGTPTGWMIVRDVLLIGPWHHDVDRSATYRRTPTDYEAEHVLLRTIRCVSGEVQTIVDCEPVLEYGRSAVRWEYVGEDYHQARATTAESRGDSLNDPARFPRIDPKTLGASKRGTHIQSTEPSGAIRADTSPSLRKP